ncbi:MAG: hypothetical protein K8R57_07975 [Verrucomicrobia bacterium]|nr:hypothetical protein [Verrucomicrobiota bacterium]
MKDQQVRIQLEKIPPQWNPTPEAFPQAFDRKPNEPDLLRFTKFSDPPLPSRKANNIVFLVIKLDMLDHRRGTAARCILMNEVANPFELPLFFVIFE